MALRAHGEDGVGEIVVQNVWSSWRGSPRSNTALKAATAQRLAAGQAEPDLELAG